MAEFKYMSSISGSGKHKIPTFILISSSLLQKQKSKKMFLPDYEAQGREILTT
jgi:hypothetical protein